MNKFQRMCGTVIRTLKQKALKDMKLKFYKMMTVPSLLYSSQYWSPNKNRSWMESSKIKFLKSLMGHRI